MKVLSLLLLCITSVLCCSNSGISMKCYSADDPAVTHYPNAVLDISCSPISGYFSSTTQSGSLSFHSTYTDGFNLIFGSGYCSVEDDGSEAHCCTTLRNPNSPVTSVDDCGASSIYCHSTNGCVDSYIEMQCSSLYTNARVRIDCYSTGPSVTFGSNEAIVSLYGFTSNRTFNDGFNVLFGSGVCSIQSDGSGAKCCSTLGYSFSGEVVSQDSCGESSVYCYGNASSKSIVFTGALLLLLFFSI
eukprot:TRINITY_DN2270_c0_g1_i2.p1 TRINITY_DN2270_c0_g1~~TRINITY_DN2270_c0_g1_i2.p1  ORF type:complete len:244 (+),score=24.92 TRINITY_DN2270_c0_g1_i2:1-732(+)